jgi:hypothetical protein
MRLWKIVFVLTVAGSLLACGLVTAAGAPTPDIATIVAGTLQALTTPASPATQAPGASTATSQPAGTQVTFANVSFVIPQGLASGAACETVPAVGEQGGAPWEVAPAYTRCTLQAYPLQGKFFEPQIMIYPAQAYAALNNGGAMSIQRLQALLASPAAAIGHDSLPHLPWANAEQMIDAQIKILGMQSGHGVRVLTEYAQYSAAINNHELFYHFEGLTSDGKAYIVTTLPINAAFLPADSNPASPVPADGIALPGTSVSDPAVWNSYYQAVTNKLNSNSTDAFQPSLTALDALMQSFSVGP